MPEPGLIRINKVLSGAGVCSRRAADELIRIGAVTVNGKQILEPGLRIDPVSDVILVHGKPVALAPETGEARNHVYVLLNKPIQTVTTVKDPQSRVTVLDLLPEALQRQRLYPVGRLDYFSEGLLLLTNDGELTNRMTHPRYHLSKVYEVKVRETPSPTALDAMRRGMILREGERLAPAHVELRPDNMLLLTLHQGLNRQIRRMCRDLRLTILRLRRVRLGPLELGELPKGKCRHLRTDEVEALKKALQLR